MNKLNILLILSLVVLGTIFINRKLNLENFANNKYSYLGCYKDGPSRDFKFGPKKYGYNKDSCSKACKKYNYFALQAGSWCSCDNVAPNYQKRPNKECGTRGLGAGWRNSVYKQNIRPSYKVGNNERICANHNQICRCDGNVIYGANQSWSRPLEVQGSVKCSNTVFGDPISGVAKKCICISDPNKCGSGIQIKVGSSIKNSKTFKLPKNAQIDDIFISNIPRNTQQPSWGDTFKTKIITKSGIKYLNVRRIDSRDGWTQNLILCGEKRKMPKAVSKPTIKCDFIAEGITRKGCFDKCLDSSTCGPTKCKKFCDDCDDSEMCKWMKPVIPTYPRCDFIPYGSTQLSCTNKCILNENCDYASCQEACNSCTDQMSCPWIEPPKPDIKDEPREPPPLYDPDGRPSSAKIFIKPSDGAVKIEWNQPHQGDSPIESYVSFIFKTFEKAEGVKINMVPFPKCKECVHVIDGLDENETYSLGIRAYNSKGLGKMSNIMTFKPKFKFGEPEEITPPQDPPANIQYNMC